MWLLDTMVISELRKRVPDQNVVSWLSSAPENSLFISVVTISEIQRGIAVQRSIDAPFAGRLQHWMNALMRNYGDRLLPITPETACRRGELSARAGHDGADVMIAATAISHGLCVATRNERHFSIFSVPVINPYLYVPGTPK